MSPEPENMSCCRTGPAHALLGGQRLRRYPVILPPGTVGTISVAHAHACARKRAKHMRRPSTAPFSQSAHRNRRQSAPNLISVRDAPSGPAGVLLPTLFFFPPSFISLFLPGIPGFSTHSQRSVAYSSEGNAPICFSGLGARRNHWKPSRARRVLGFRRAFFLVLLSSRGDASAAQDSKSCTAKMNSRDPLEGMGADWPCQEADSCEYVCVSPSA